MNRMKKKTSILALILALTLALMLIPATVFAASQTLAGNVTIDDEMVTFNIQENTGLFGALSSRTYTITANTFENAKFDSWHITGAAANFITNVSDTTDTLVFTKSVLASGNVTVSPLYNYAHAVTVTGGTANLTMAYYNDTVTLTADEPAPGQYFDGWTVETVVEEGQTPATIVVDPTTNSFTMPANVAVKATANFPDLPRFPVTVNGGTSDLDDPDYPGQAYTGQTVTITATPQDGMKFVNWTADDVDGMPANVVFADENAAVTTFEMGEVEVSVTANFVKIDEAPKTGIGSMTLWTAVIMMSLVTVGGTLAVYLKRRSKAN